MTNIEKALLSNVYPHVDIALLEEVINATPNTELATEIICGIYLEPEVPVMVNNDDKTRIYTLEKYDKWKDQVNYSYMAPRMLSGYFPYSIDKSHINETNYKELKSDSGSGDGFYHHAFPSTEMVKSTSNMELSRWMKLHDKAPIDMFEKALDEAERSIDEPHVVHQMSVGAIEELASK